jgi:hypothetical protein
MFVVGFLIGLVVTAQVGWLGLAGFRGLLGDRAIEL